MSEQDWNLFFELLEKIISQPGSWQEKKDALEKEAADRGDIALGEFLGWFSE